MTDWSFYGRDVWSNRELNIHARPVPPESLQFVAPCAHPVRACRRGQCSPPQRRWGPIGRQAMNWQAPWRSV